MVWYPHPFKNVSQFVVIHTVQGFSIAKEAQVDVFLEISCFFYDPTDVDSLSSGSSTFSKSSLYIWKFSVHVLLNKLKDFEHYLAFRIKAKVLSQISNDLILIFPTPSPILTLCPSKALRILLYKPNLTNFIILK